MHPTASTSDTQLNHFIISVHPTLRPASAIGRVTINFTNQQTTCDAKIIMPAAIIDCSTPQVRVSRSRSLSPDTSQSMLPIFLLGGDAAAFRIKYANLFTRLASHNLLVPVITDATVALQLLKADYPIPAIPEYASDNELRGVLIADGFLANKAADGDRDLRNVRYELLRNQVAREGVTVIAMGDFARGIARAAAAEFFEEVGLGWKTVTSPWSLTGGAQDSMSLLVREGRNEVGGVSVKKLPRRWPNGGKVLVLEGVDRRHAWYGRAVMKDADEKKKVKAGVAGARVGEKKGLVAYVGDWGIVKEADEVVLGLLGLL